MQQMITAIINELLIRAPYFAPPAEVGTIYFGGGTPSLLPSADLSNILSAVKNNFRLAPHAELTLECNPDDVTISNLAQWRLAGINRLSIGIQSFDDEILKVMNRAHSSEMATQAVLLAQKADFHNISIDLMYGLPGLTMDRWQQTLALVSTMQVQHLSCYALTLEERTALAHMARQGKIIVPDDEEVARQFEYLMQWAPQCGFEHYEISNFAQPNYRSQHNSNYWFGGFYAGFGPSAHSYNGGTRQWNVADNNAYIHNVMNGLSFSESETLSPSNIHNEYIMLRLRHLSGIDTIEMAKKFTPIIAHTFIANITPFVADGKVMVNNHRYTLTPFGKMYADAIAVACFVDE